MVSPSTQFCRGDLRPHRISGCFEFSEHLRKTGSWVARDAITPEAGGVVSLIGVLQENFVHQDWHRFFALK